MKYVQRNIPGSGRVSLDFVMPKGKSLGFCCLTPSRQKFQRPRFSDKGK